MKFKFNLFDYINHIILLLVGLVTLFPFWQMLVIAFSTTKVYLADDYHLIPRSFTMNVFFQLLADKAVLTGFEISIFITAAGWFISMFLSIIGAYVLSKKDIIGRKFMLKMVMLTMFFTGGMSGVIIPLFLVVKNLRMTDTLFSLFLPFAINSFYLLLLKNYFLAIPKELEEAAYIDGYNDFQVLYKIIIPISMPVIAAVSLFYIVQLWNDFFPAMLFLSRERLYPISLILRNIVVSKTMITNSAAIELESMPRDQYNMALIVVTMLPIVVLYPFIQKYFVQGIMVGAIKG
jgi:putative aldouronate transport system permease protein